MQIRRFLVQDIKEAIRIVKKELGADAVILTTRHVKDPSGAKNKKLEVTAAVDRMDSYSDENRDFYLHDSPEIKQKAEPSIGKRISELETKIEKIETVISPEEFIPKMKQLETGLEHLKSMIGDLLKHVENNDQNVTTFQFFHDRFMRELYERLILGGVDSQLARILIKETEERLKEKKLPSGLYGPDQLAEVIMERANLTDPFEKSRSNGPGIHALVGPTGVGKTTTVAKLAANQVFEKGKRCCLLTLDTFRIGATEQLNAYAKIMKIPIEVALDEIDLAHRIENYKNMDIIFLDTAGVSQKDVKMMNELAKSLTCNCPITVHLILSATTSQKDLHDVVERFAILKPSTLIISKLDEANTFGKVYNILHTHKIPTSFFTVGQNVPDDIEPATKERIAALLLDVSAN